MLSTQLIEKTKANLFATEEEMAKNGLAATERERTLRVRELYARWIADPTLSAADIRRLAGERGAGERQSYEDVALVKICLGDMHVMKREWYQYLFLQRIEEGFHIAREQNDARAFASLASALGKYTRLDAAEPALPAEPPQLLVFTSDATAAGYERIADQECRQIERRYSGETLDFKQETISIEQEPNVERIT